jgi:hypothetical protein
MEENCLFSTSTIFGGDSSLTIESMMKTINMIKEMFPLVVYLMPPIYGYRLIEENCNRNPFETTTMNIEKINEIFYSVGYNQYILIDPNLEEGNYYKISGEKAKLIVKENKIS